jgi:hypothetical protein
VKGAHFIFGAWRACESGKCWFGARNRRCEAQYVRQTTSHAIGRSYFVPWYRALLGIMLTFGTITALFGCDTRTDKPKSSAKGVVHQKKVPRAAEPLGAATYDMSKVPQVYGMRKFPYPYQAMLALSSDADSETLRKFNLVHQFINTREMTPAGRGLGLDFADSFFMYNANNQHGYVDIHHQPMSHELSYFQGVTNQPYGAAVIHRYIHAGWIDTIHTFGDFSQVDQTKTRFTRRLAQQGIEALKQAGDHITVWTDHGNKSNVDNFGSYGIAPFFNYQQGANPTSPYYHTDFTIPYGVRFVWADNSSEKFGMNSMIYPLRLPDGRRVWGFSRHTSYGYNSKGGPLWDWTVWQISRQLTPAHLHDIEKRHQYSIVAQHLNGGVSQFPLPEESIRGLKLLAREYHHGSILVARTSRLLQYNVAQQYVKYKVTHVDGKAFIHILSIDDPVFGIHVPTLDEIRGLTFYTSNPDGTVIEIGDKPIPTDLVQRHPSDGVHPSVSVQWYPSDTTNYAITAPGVY